MEQCVILKQTRFCFSTSFAKSVKSDEQYCVEFISLGEVKNAKFVFEFDYVAPIFDEYSELPRAAVRNRNWALLAKLVQ